MKSTVNRSSMFREVVRFILRIVVLSVILLPLNFYILEEWMEDLSFGRSYYLMYFYFIGLTLALQWMWVKSVLETPEKFTMRFLSGMGIGILMSAFLLLAHLYFKEEKLLDAYGLNFLILYLLYMYLGVYNAFKLYRKVMAAKKEESEEEVAP